MKETTRALPPVTTTLRGSCLCGAVRYSLDGGVQFINHCHCSMCRKVHGAAFGSFLHADGAGFRWIAGADSLVRYASSPGNERAFCRVCGSNVPVLEDDGAHVIVPAGTLDDDPGVRPAAHIYTGSNAPWFEIADALPRFERHAPDDFWDAAAAGHETVLRAALRDDVAGIAACVCAAYLPYVERIGRQPGPMLEDYAEVVARKHVHVAERAARIVGVLVLDETSDGAFIDNVAVHPSLHGTGIGRRLLRLAEAEARRLGHDSIALSTHELMAENQALYARIGYRLFDRRVTNGFARVFMRKSLR